MINTSESTLAGYLAVAITLLVTLTVFAVAFSRGIELYMPLMMLVPTSGCITIGCIYGISLRDSRDPHSVREPVVPVPSVAVANMWKDLLVSGIAIILLAGFEKLLFNVEWDLVGSILVVIIAGRLFLLEGYFIGVASLGRLSRVAAYLLTFLLMLYTAGCISVHFMLGPSAYGGIVLFLLIVAHALVFYYGYRMSSEWESQLARKG